MKKFMSLLILMTMISSAFAFGGSSAGSSGSSVSGPGGTVNTPSAIPGSVNSNVNAAPGTFNRQQLDQQMKTHNDRINENQRFNNIPNAR